VHIRLPRQAAAAWETNLMETVQNSLALDTTGTVLNIPTNPYEIKTVKVHFSNPEPRHELSR
jgi:hypothetical protein